MKKRLLILGAGTAGTIMANHLRKKIRPDEWTLTIVDQDPNHYYQPGFLFLPFGLYEESDIVKPKERQIGNGVEYLDATIERVDPDSDQVFLRDGSTLGYDILVIATGTRPNPGETDGMTEGDWQEKVFEFYTYKGACALRDKMAKWKGGRLVVHICEMPIKCPVAPLEFTFLADWWLGERGLRHVTEITYVTPLSGAFTKPTAAGILGHLLEEKRIHVVHDFNIARVDSDKHAIVSWDDREVPYDMLVTVPVNMGDPMVERSGFGDELNYVPTHKHTLQSKVRDNIFVIGDATDVPTSKAGSVAHFEAEVLTANILRHMRGEPLQPDFDGHANCFIESGHHKGFLLDFNYDLEPVPGTFPVPGIGPFSLLGESYLNHLGKLAFKWIYWHVLLKGLPIPFIDHRMSRAGKRIPSGLAGAKP